MKDLVIGKDYGAIFGLDAKNGNKMIYNGGINWTAIKGEKTMTMDSKGTTDNAVEYVSKPSTMMGKF